MKRPYALCLACFLPTVTSSLAALVVNDGESTAVPTISNSTAPSLAPSSTNAPSNSSATISPVPTMAPSIGGSSAPSAAPMAGVTDAPTVTKGDDTAAPATSPPTAAPAPAPAPAKRMSFFRFIEKTIALFIFLVLSLLAFGAIMSNRYRIYFFLRGVWYTILGLECTRWIMRKLRISDGGYQPVDQGLNTVIFENEMDQGLLMRETDT